MPDLSRRELLAWMAAGSATVATGWSYASRSSTEPSSAGGPASASSSASTSATSGVVGQGGGAVMPGTASETASSGLAAVDDRVLVVVEMGGGNDGLSTVVPHGLAGYYDARPSTAVPAEEVLRIDDEIGFHPALQQVSQRGAAVIQGVGSTDPDGSHFEMMQRWWRGTPDGAEHGPGWIGRLADTIVDPDAVVGAVSIGSGTHPIISSRSAPTLALPGADAAWYLAGADNDVESTFQRGVRAFGAAPGRTDTHAAMNAMTASTVSLAEQLIAEDEDDRVEYPGGSFSDSLRFTRRLIELDGGVRIVHVVMNGDFDTHEGHAWRHPDLMETFDAAVGAFWDDIDGAGLNDRVMLMTTSEFGRTMKENASGGLDHGTASTALVMGPVEPARLGDHPSLTKLDENDDLIATVPFDSYLGAVVEQWFEVPAGEVFDGDPEVLDLSVSA